MIVIMKQRIHVYYSGRVQGVGFRFTAQRLAGDLGISGWVRNLPDGRVEITAEAEEKALKDLLTGIMDLFKNYIKDTDIQWTSASGEFEEFSIKF